MSQPQVSVSSSTERSARRLPAFLTFSRNIQLLLLQNLVVFVGLGVQSLTLNLYLVALGYREDFLGLISFANTISIGVAALPASGASNRFGARRCLIVASAGLAVSGVAAVSWASPFVIVPAMVAVGICQAFIFVPMAPYLLENASPSDHQRTFAASFAVLSVGSVLGSMLGGLLPGLIAGGSQPGAAGYRVALLVGAAIAAFGSTAMLLASDRPPTRESSADSATTGRDVDADGADGVNAELDEPTRRLKIPGGTSRQLFATPEARATVRRELIAMAVAAGLLSASTGLIVPFFNVYLYDQTGASTEAVGLVYAVGAAAMAPASLIGPAMSRWVGVVPLIALARLSIVPVLLMPLVATSFGVGFTAYVLRAALVSITQPIDNAFAMSRVPDYLRARVAAIRTLSWNASWAIASAGAGSVIVHWGYAPTFAAAAILTCACVVVHYLVFRRPAPTELVATEKQQ